MTFKWWTNSGLFILRVCFGLYMVFAHGTGKFEMLLNGTHAQFPDPIGLGTEISVYLITFAEFFCAILVTVGFLTRLASLPLVVAMFIAAFIHEGLGSFAKIELPVLYLTGFLVLFFTGPGDYSLSGKMINGKGIQSKWAFFL